MWTGERYEDVPIFYREDIPEAAEGEGPSLILDSTGTIVVERGFRWTFNGGSLVLHDALVQERHRLGDQAEEQEGGRQGRDREEDLHGCRPGRGDDRG